MFTGPLPLAFPGPVPVRRNIMKPGENGKEKIVPHQVG